VSTATLIAVVSVAIATLSFIVNFWVGQRAAARARKPVLVFVDDPERGCWVLQNVGNGPALNVLVAHQGKDGKWFNPVFAPPLAKEANSRSRFSRKTLRPRPRFSRNSLTNQPSGRRRAAHRLKTKIAGRDWSIPRIRRWLALWNGRFVCASSSP
jgi:hypothetical protein